MHYNLNDYTYIVRGDGYKSKRYRHWCQSCNIDRGYAYINKIKREPLCHSCRMKTEDTRNNIGQQSSGRKLNEESRTKKSKSLVNMHRRKAGLPELKTDEEWNNWRHKQHIHSNMASLLNHKLKAHGTSKFNTRTFTILGYSVNDLMEHLEKLFKPGMTWDNYGDQWHIDHIIPDSWFDYVDYTDQTFKNCWSLNNLQPLWKTDNLVKGNRYVG